MDVVVQCLIRDLGEAYQFRLLRENRNEQTRTPVRRRYASNEAHAARVNTDLRLAAYASLAARCRSGGRSWTSRTECRMLFMI